MSMRCNFMGHHCNFIEHSLTLHWKLIETFDPAGLELYNLGDDLGESINLAVKRPELAKALHDRLRQWRQSAGAEMMTLNPDYAPEKKAPHKGKRK